MHPHPSPEHPRVSVITVNFRQSGLTRDFLHSLRQTGFRLHEVIVVDNGSGEDLSDLEAGFPEVTWIRSPRNLGFAGGNNLGLKACTGDFILLANNDTLVPRGCIEALLGAFEQAPSAGIVSPKILFHDSGGIIQYAGTGRIHPLTGRGHTTGFGERDQGQYDAAYPTELCHGACMMLRREVLERVGPMDESYFLYYEEYDYCERAKRAGFGIGYTGLGFIWHRQSMTVGKRSVLKSYYLSRNRLYFIRKHIRGLEQALAMAFFLLVALPKNVLRDLLVRQPGHAAAHLRGAWHNLRLQVNP